MGLNGSERDTDITNRLRHIMAIPYLLSLRSLGAELRVSVNQIPQLTLDRVRTEERHESKENELCTQARATRVLKT